MCFVYFFGGLAKCLGSGWWDGSNLWRSLIRPPFNLLSPDILVRFKYVLPMLGISICLIELGYVVFIWMKKTPVLLVGLHFGDARRHRTDNGNVSFRSCHDCPESCRVRRRFRSSFPQASRCSWAGFHAVSSGKTTLAVTGRDPRKSNRRCPVLEILSIAKNGVRTRARPRRSVWIWKC